MNCLIVGISGGSCSGKTTLAQNIKEKFEDRAVIIQHDNYYMPRNGVPDEIKSKINYDHPGALDTELLISHLNLLKNRQSIDCPIYDFTIHDRSNVYKKIKSAPVIIVDGMMILQNEQLRNLLDIKIFVDTDADERLARRILRDMSERGRSMESVISQYTETVKPMHNIYVEPYRKLADIVINGEEIGITSELIYLMIEGKLNCDD